jgi:hypothetical protein
MAPCWLWTSHIRHDRIVTATAAIHQAQQYQTSLRIHGKCVSSLPGWNADPDEGPGALITELKLTGKRLTIECDQKQKKFWLSISFPRDNFGYLEGESTGPLKAAYWRGEKLETKVIGRDTDIATLAKLLASRK